MSEGVGKALETIVAGGLFCVAVTMLLLLHTALLQQAEGFEGMPEQLILFEEGKGELWRHSDE